jgi:hypothetical protein
LTDSEVFVRIELPRESFEHSLDAKLDLTGCARRGQACLSGIGSSSTNSVRIKCRKPSLRHQAQPLSFDTPGSVPTFQLPPYSLRSVFQQPLSISTPQGVVEIQISISTHESGRDWRMPMCHELLRRGSAEGLLGYKQPFLA